MTTHPRCPDLCSTPPSQRMHPCTLLCFSWMPGTQTPAPKGNWPSISPAGTIWDSLSFILSQVRTSETWVSRILYSSASQSMIQRSASWVLHMNLLGGQVLRFYLRPTESEICFLIRHTEDFDVCCVWELHFIKVHLYGRIRRCQFSFLRA